MRNRWSSVTIGELCDQGVALIQTGPFGSQLHAHEYRPFGTPVIPTEAIGRRRIINENLPCVDAEVVERLARHRLLVGDILFARRGAQATGSSAIVEKNLENALCGTGAILMRVREPKSLDATYLSFALASPLAMQWLRDHAVGAVMPNLNADIIRRLEIPFPSFAEQQAIASILGAFDDKIELNRKMNETLEAMARALFKSWFVDFDPVRAKSEGRAPSGMDAETAKLFPSEFVDSELGPIPRGWSHVQVKDVCAGLFDGPHATPAEADSGAVFLGIKNFTPTALELTDLRYISDADYPAWTKRVVPQPGDIVFTYEATLGFFALIPPGLRCCLGRRTALVRPRSEARDSHYLFEWFVARPFQDFLRAHRAPGSTVDRIWLKDFPSYPVLQPPSDVVKLFEVAAAPLWARIHSSQSESATLAKLRDALLPRLLSGELSVSVAERTASEVL